MAKKAALLLITGLVGYLAAAGVPVPGSAEPAADQAASWFSLRGKVTRAVDGDTLHVRVGKKTETVRLIGVDAPERGGCFAPEASALMRRLALDKTVRLTGDRTQTRRDVYRRLLAYVALPSGVDVGRYLLVRGYATLYETQRPFARRNAYADAAARAEATAAGLYPVCGSMSQPAPPPTTVPPTTTITPPLPVVPTIPTTTTPAANCAPSYPDMCIPPPPPDLDCGQIAHRGFRVIYTVPSPDPHRFDGDRDGVGCES